MNVLSVRTLVLTALISVATGVAASPVASAADATSAPTAQIETFSPQGYVKGVRQATARFTAPMVAIGDPRLDDPFTVDCPAAGKGRWADGRNWVYDFDEDLEAGIACRFTAKANLKALSGATVKSAKVFTFNTGGPAIAASLPREGWEELDEEQVFLLRLDAPATVESIQAHAWCVIEGVSEHVPVTVLTGADRATILEQRKAMGYDYLQLLWKNGASSNVRIRNRSMEQQDALLTVLRCERALPPATKVLLKWGAGIATSSGLATKADQQLAFRVRPAFTAQVECARVNVRAGCNPLQAVSVSFSTPVPRTVALAIRFKSSSGTEFKPTARDAGDAPFLSEVSVAGPLPEESSLTVTLPKGLVDDAGRPLQNVANFPVTVRVDRYPPLAKFSGTFGILEAREGGVLPVTLRNVEPQLAAREATLDARSLRLSADPAAVAGWLKRVEAAENPSGEWVTVASGRSNSALKTKIEDQDDEEDGSSDENGTRRAWRDSTGTKSVFNAADTTSNFAIKKSLGQKPEEVVGIPLKQPGFYVLEIQSRILGSALLGRDDIRYVATAALVTDLAVHLKWGRESSRVWVTHLSDGSVVSGAQVVITDYCNGSTLWQGTTDRDGLASVAQSFGEPHDGSACYNRDHPLLVLAKQGQDFSFTQSGWDRGITPYQFALPVGSGYSTGIAHTVFDRMLFRAGETVSMQHFLRRHVMDGIAVTRNAAGVHKLDIAHQGSGEHYKYDVRFGEDGVGENEWKIPDEAKLGDYSVSIDDALSGTFKVEQFRLPLMHASVSGPARPLVQPKSATLDLHVAYLSGGGAAGLAVKLRTLVEPRPLQYADYTDYQFGGESVQEGITSSGEGPADYDFEADPERQTTRTQILPVTLDETGTARVSIDKLPPLSGPAQLTAELEYTDPNGEIQTSTGHVRLLASSLNLGIRREGWVASPEQVRFRVVVLDVDGKPQARQAVNVMLYQSNSYSYRKRLIGGFYAYETTREIKKLKTGCTGTTDAQGLLLCEIAPGVSGQLLVRAEARDSQAAVSGATTSIWVAGQEDWWFGGTSGDRMDVLPEKKEYQAGETARFQVRMPFRSATALVTVEREGVLSSFVTHLSGKAPVVEVPIDGNYSPNVFVSVLAVRGRVAHVESDTRKIPPGAEITALVDLNKPAYRIGIAMIKVGWKPHRLEVSVQPAQSVYKVRDQAQVKIHVSTAMGTPLPAGTEIAVAAVDEALLDLASNTSWNLLESMMGERGLEVWTSTAQMQVVGKRHYGRKAVPHGGGGGRDRARELFDSLLYWKARVVVDANGDASVSIPLNDSLSAFRIVAVAHGGAQLFGTGIATINTTQDVMLLSGLPPLVREGDQFAAVFTVRNTTDAALTVNVQATVNPKPAGALAPQRVEIPGGQSRDVSWSVTAPVGGSKLAWDVTATVPGSSARDRLKVSEALVPAFPVRTYQATIAQLTAPLVMPAEMPRGAIPGRGGLNVSLQSKLAGNLAGVREYMSLYPYICLEQQISRSVVLRDRRDWDSLMDRLPAYMDGDGLLKYFPTDRLEGDDSLTAYVLAIANEAGWPIPDGSRERLVQALTRFVNGRLVRRSALPTADLSIRKLTAIEALARYDAATSSMLDSITIEPNLWPTSAVLDWLGILKRVPGLSSADERSRDALGILRSRLNFQGTTMGFSTERNDALWWLMISTDSNANRMLLSVLEQPAWREDIPRLVRGALGRQQFGHWNTTVANAWGVLAVEKFSLAFESTAVAGTTDVSYGPEQHQIKWPQETGTAAVSLPWQKSRADLKLAHNGAGPPWAMVRATAALPLDKPLSTGFKVTRTVTAIEQSKPGVWTRGDVVRVHLDLQAQSDMSWVVVDDPIPAGATILGSGLGGQSALLTRDDKGSGFAWLAFEERRFDFYRAYYRFVPKGRWSVEYTLRLNNPGTFLQPATRVEAMYAPEMLGEVPNAAVVVQPSP